MTDRRSPRESMSGRDKARSSANQGTRSTWENCKGCSRPRTFPQSSIDLPGIKKLRSGKVREVFDLGDTLLFVVTDRMSAFDVILPDPIPFKGAVLNQISAFWFQRFQKIDNHFVTADFDQFPAQLKKFRDQLAGRSMIVRKTIPLT